MRKEKAFTLIELITTLTVLGILLLIAVPKIISSTEYWVLESTAREMVQDIRHAQQMAINEGREYNFEIHITDKYYRVRQNTTKGITIKRLDIDNRIETITSTLPRYSGSYASLRILTYTPTGNPSQTGSIVLTTKGGKSLTITIAVGTGRVMIVR